MALRASTCAKRASIDDSLSLSLLGDKNVPYELLTQVDLSLSSAGPRPNQGVGHHVVGTAPLRRGTLADCLTIASRNHVKITKGWTTRFGIFPMCGMKRLHQVSTSGLSPLPTLLSLLPLARMVTNHTTILHRVCIRRRNLLDFNTRILVQMTPVLPLLISFPVRDWAPTRRPVRLAPGGCFL